MIQPSHGSLEFSDGGGVSVAKQFVGRSVSLEIRDCLAHRIAARTHSVGLVRRRVTGALVAGALADAQESVDHPGIDRRLRSCYRDIDWSINRSRNDCGADTLWATISRTSGLIHTLSPPACIFSRPADVPPTDALRRATIAQVVLSRP
jgi:hypothetical protein